MIHLKSSFARGAGRKLFDSYTGCTICNKTDVGGKIDGGIDDTRFSASKVEEQGEGAGSACASEEREAVTEKM